MQCFAGLSSILAFWLLKSEDAALSAALGASIFIIPQQYFTLKAFRYMGARSVMLTVQSFYKGESSKLLLIAIGFALTFTFYKELDVSALFAAFILLVVINGFIPLLMKQKENAH
jgi:ATP synthase protein I